MGLEERRFVTVIEEGWKCGLCGLVLDNPLKAPCGCVFCAGCVLPAVLARGHCPRKECRRLLSPGELQNVLELRNNILSLQVKCDNMGRGCTQIVTLAALPEHLKACNYRLAHCQNRGCTEVMPYRELPKHESEKCCYRPVGICQSGCNLVLRHCNANKHHCINSLRCHISDQEFRLNVLNADIKKMAAAFNNREKNLLNQISNLHNIIQTQAAKFCNKTAEYKNQVAYLAKLALEEQRLEETTLAFKLERENGNSLGFNITGGCLEDAKVSEGIYISKITDDSVAEKKGLQLQDQILKVSVSSSLAGQDLFTQQNLMVNGQDLSKSSHEDAVEAFRTAKEPIVVEVLRRVSKNNNTKMKSRLPPMVTVATQTDEYIENSYFSLLSPPSPPPGFPCPLGGLCQPSSRHAVAFSPTGDLGLSDLEMANCYDYEEDFDPDRGYDVEYEEVSLIRSSSEDKVGLTLCYGSADDDVTDIYISEVEPYSIAGQDGRIREGDQILQINGVDVHSREQAIQLFADKRSEITLLVARPQAMQMDDGFMDERNGLDDLHALEALDQPHHRLDFTSSLLGQAINEEGETTDTATTENSQKHEKDSGVGRTDDSTRNDESSEQEIMETECASPGSNSKFGGSGELHYSNDSFTSNEAPENAEGDFSAEIPAEECQKFREVLETRCSSKEGSPHKGTPRKDSGGSIEREIAALNQEMEQIQMECQEIVEAHTREQHRVKERSEAIRPEPFRSPRMVPRMGTRLDYIKHACQQDGGDPVWVRHEQLARMNVNLNQLSASGLDSTMESRKLGSEEREKEKDNGTSTTSAYNTGESCRSTPLTLELQQEEAGPGGHKLSMLSLSAPATKPSHSDGEKPVSSQTQKEWGSDGDARLRNHSGKTGSQSSVSRMSQTQDTLQHLQEQENLHDLYTQYADVMYTNRANLEHTIMVQQRLFQQQLMQRAAKTNPTDGATSLNMANGNHLPPTLNNNTLPNGCLPNGTVSNGRLRESGSPVHSSGSPSHKSASPSHKSASHKSASHSHKTASPTHRLASPSHSSSSRSHQPHSGPSPSTSNGNPPSPLASSPGLPLGLPAGLQPDTQPVIQAASGVQMEWVVKRRADGSRYVTRRPVRNKLLKERSRKIAEERAGMTTDDDAVSELKVGRYWKKEDRRKHLEHSRDRKRQKELVMKQRMETLKENEAESKTKGEQTIVELSHKKMMKYKGKKVFDDFTTLQEMLAHGSREPTGKTYNPLLSVTTV